MLLYRFIHYISSVTPAHIILHNAILVLQGKVALQSERGNTRTQFLSRILLCTNPVKYQIIAHRPCMAYTYIYKTRFVTLYCLQKCLEKIVILAEKSFSQSQVMEPFSLLSLRSYSGCCIHRLPVLPSVSEDRFEYYASLACIVALSHCYVVRIHISSGNISKLAIRLEFSCSVFQPVFTTGLVLVKWAYTGSVDAAETQVTGHSAFKHDDICALANCACLVDTHLVRSFSSRYSKPQPRSYAFTVRRLQYAKTASDRKLDGGKTWERGQQTSLNIVI